MVVELLPNPTASESRHQMPDIEIIIQVTEGYNLDTKIRVAGTCGSNKDAILGSLNSLTAKAARRTFAAVDATEGSA